MTHVSQAPRHRERLPRRRRSRRRRPGRRRGRARALRPPPGRRRRRPDRAPPGCRRRRLHDGAPQRRRRARRDERQRHPVPRVGRRPRGARRRRPARRRHRRRPAHVVSTSSDGDAVRRATVDMGPVTFDPAAIPLDAPSAFDLEATFHGTTYHGDAAGMGNPHLVLLVDDVAAARVTQHGPHLEHDAAVPERHQRRVRRRSIGRGRLATAGLGARRGRDAVVRHRRVRRGGGRASARPRRRASSSSRCPGGDPRSSSARRSASAVPVVHVFDVDVDVDELMRSVDVSRRDGRGRRRLTATEVDLEVVQQRALLVGTGVGTPRRRGGRGVARGARAPHRHRGRRAGRDASCSGATGPTRRPTSGAGKAEELRELAEALDIDLVVFDDELTPGAAAQPREAVRARRRRPRRADPRHLRPARDEPGGHGAGRARAAPLPPAAAPRPRRASSASRPVGIGDPAGPGETQLEVDRRRILQRDHEARAGPRSGSAKTRATQRKARRRRACPTRRARRLHERREVDAAQPAHRTPTCSSRTGCSRRSTRRRAGCASPAARPSCAPTRSASSAGSRTSSSRRSARRSKRSSTPTCSSTSSTAPRPTPRTRSTRCATVLGEIGAERRPRAARRQQDRRRRPGRASPSCSRASRGASRSRRRPATGSTSSLDAIGDRLRALASVVELAGAVRPGRRARGAAPRGRGARRGARRRRHAGAGPPAAGAERLRASAEFVADRWVGRAHGACGGASRGSSRRRTRTTASASCARSPTRVPGGIVDCSVGHAGRPDARGRARAALVGAGAAPRGTRRRSARRRSARPRPAWIAPPVRRATVDADAVVACIGTKELVASLPRAARRSATRAATPCCTRRCRTRPTRWARRSPGCARCRCRSTTHWHLDLDAVDRGRRRRVRSCSGCNDPANPTGVTATRRGDAPRRSRGHASAGSSSRATSATPSSPTTTSGAPAAPVTALAGGARRRARGALAVEAVEHGGLPRRVRRRRPRPRRVPRRGAQARRADDRRRRCRPRRPPRSATTRTSTSSGPATRRRRAALRAGARARSGSCTTAARRPSTSGCAAPAGRATAGRSPRDLAEAGLLVAPGDLYGPAGARHVRLALTRHRRPGSSWPCERLDAALSEHRGAVERPRAAHHRRSGSGATTSASVMPSDEARAAVHEAIDLLDRGEARVAEVVDGEVVVHEWLK